MSALSPLTAMLAQAGDAPAPAPPPLSVFDFFLKGGPVMIPITLCSLIALAVVIERSVRLRRHAVIPPDFLPGLRAALKDPRRDRAAAVEYCRANDSPVARVFAAGIKRLGEPEETISRHVQEAGEREVPGLRARLRMLSVIASVSTLLGLLGTITGMITAFQTVAASGAALGRTELLARGIYEAMITTAAGLIVAIPTVICYHWLSARIDALVQRLDRMTVDFIEEFAAPSITAPDPEAAPAPRAPADPASPPPHAAGAVAPA